MEIKYSIIDFSPADDIFVIAYYTDTFLEGIKLNLPLPVNDDETAFLSGDELNKYILSYAPTDALARKEKIIMFDDSEIESMVLYEEGDNK